LTKALTDIAIRNLKHGATRREIPVGGAKGLYVIVQPSGAKSYALRYRLAGKPQKLTLGRVLMPESKEEKGTENRSPKKIDEPQIGDVLSLAGARKLANDVHLQINRGRDPRIGQRQAKQEQRLEAENTFRAVAEEYLKREGSRLRSADWRRKVLERLVYRTLGDRPIVDIRRSEIIRLLDKIEEGQLLDRDGDPIEGGPVMADRTLALIRKIMNWHATRSDDFRSPIVRGMARVKAKDNARERTLTDDELRAVWKAADAAVAAPDKGGAVYQRPFEALVQFLLLTAARRSEGAQMRRAELTGADWTLPASRNKTKVDLIRPLSVMARGVLSKVVPIMDCEFVFSTDGEHPISGFSRFKSDFDEACGVTGWTLHDLRRTARSLMSRGGVNSDHAERCLGHVIAGVRGTYDRHEYHAEKKAAYEALAVQIDQIVNPKPNVVPMRPKQRRSKESA
jgi:integrase